jgi:hypothetical protein
MSLDGGSSPFATSWPCGVTDSILGFDPKDLGANPGGVIGA